MLSAEDVVHSYSRRPRRAVLDHVTWDVRPGVRTMLLGPNGAGKSTLLRLMAGVTAPRDGRVTLDGSTDRSALMRRVGWMPQDVRPLSRLTVVEQVEYSAWLAGHTTAESRVRAREAVERVDLTGRADLRVGQLSGGQLRRVGLAQALARGGDALLLDEPTAGLDPEQIMLFRALVAGIDCPAGVVVSTHQVADLEQVADAVVVLAGGRICFDGTVDDFLALGKGPSRAEQWGAAYASVVTGHAWSTT